MMTSPLTYIFQQTDRSTRLVASVITVFIICWLPNQIMAFLAWKFPNNIFAKGLDVKNTDGSIHILTSAIAFSNRNQAAHID